MIGGVMRAPDKIATVAIATVAAVLVTVAGFALGSGDAAPRNTDLPSIATGVDPAATPADTAAEEPIVPNLPAVADDDDDDGDDRRETVKHPVRVDLPDDDDDDDDDEKHEDDEKRKDGRDADDEHDDD